MALSVPDKIQIGDVSSYLAQIDVLKSSLFGRKLDPRLPLMLEIETDAIRWRNDIFPTDPTLLQTSNYLYELCGRYINKALVIISGAGSGTPITPIAPSGYVYVSIPYVVTATEMYAGAPVNLQTVWVNPLFIGALSLTSIIIDNTVETIGFGFTFDNINGVITRINPFFTNSVVIISFLKKI